MTKECNCYQIPQHQPKSI